jgi:hypothetical protein
MTVAIDNSSKNFKKVMNFRDLWMLKANPKSFDEKPEVAESTKSR